MVPRIPIAAVYSIEYHRLSNSPFFHAFLPTHVCFHHTELHLFLHCWVQVGSKKSPSTIWSGTAYRAAMEERHSEEEKKGPVDGKRSQRALR
jgi:hypothetical protein